MFVRQNLIIAEYIGLAHCDLKVHRVATNEAFMLSQLGPLCVERRRHTFTNKARASAKRILKINCISYLKKRR